MVKVVKVVRIVRLVRGVRKVMKVRVGSGSSGWFGFWCRRVRVTPSSARAGDGWGGGDFSLPQPIGLSRSPTEMGAMVAWVH